MRGLLVHAQQHLAADHHAREPFLGRAFARDRVDLLPAAQDGDPVGDVEHLVQLVRDEDHRHALGDETFEDLEQLDGLLRRQHGRGLVEDEDVRAPVERFQNLDALLLADGDRLHACVRVDVEPELVGELAHAALGGGRVEQHTVTARFGGEHDVLRDRHHRDEHEVLVHHPDAGVDRAVRRREVGSGRERP